MWRKSHRFDPAALVLADRHYSRRKPGTPQFVPPGRCTVLLRPDAVWVTSWPFAEYVRHAWPGAWVNSMFRSEGSDLASSLILSAIAATRSAWNPPELGIVTFVDPRKVPGTKTRKGTVYGYCYMKAGFEHVGFTKGGLWAWQMLPAKMPDPCPAIGMQSDLILQVAE